MTYDVLLYYDTSIAPHILPGWAAATSDNNTRAIKAPCLQSYVQHMQEEYQEE